MDEQHETKPRGPYAQALKQVDELKALCAECAKQLEQASLQRAGLMDSESRQAEVHRELQGTIASVARRLREVQ